ncbi:MAG: adenine-specific methyltransferase EcoRI family protein [Candidatus Omnitrophota bacterium]|nr:adenine-specific methyltransferase EcoRI family protein [Candidatus Omnitrophota bacterium]
MSKKTLNTNLHKARQAKNDEFYTQLTDIEKELSHYKKHFKGKVVLCNCDDPKVSNFFHYFSNKFGELGLKKLITTCYKNQNADLFSENDSEKAVYLEYAGEKQGGKVPTPERIGLKHLQGDGDFRSKESIELLKQSDIVVTNPPFSLFREYVAQLVKYGKQFVIIGDQNATTYKEIFTLIRDNKIWLGMDNYGTKWFGVKDHYDIATKSRVKIENGQKFFSSGRIVWLTNLDTAKRHQDLILYKKYSRKEYPKYDNYDAINVDKYAEIPCDYDGAMGVPITFLDKYNPDQFKIISANDIRTNDNTPFKEHGLIKDNDGTINGKPTYVRIVIKRKRATCKSRSKK